MYKKWICFFILVIGLGTFFIFTGCQQDQIRLAEEDVQVKVATYNVLFGNWCNPKRVGEALKPYNFDIIGFTEVPSGNWTKEVGEILGLKYYYVGKMSINYHKDKHRSILSRTPLRNLREIKIPNDVWAGVSIIVGETVVNGVKVDVFCLHIPDSDKAAGSAAEYLAKEIIPDLRVKNLVMLGDYNNLHSDPPLMELRKAGMRPSWDDLALDLPELSTHKHIQSGKESGVIDHIYYRSESGIKALDGGILEFFNPPDIVTNIAKYDEEWSKYGSFESDHRRFQKEWFKYGKPLSDHRLIWALLEFASE